MMGVAQDGNHVQMQNVGNLSFIPSWFSNDGLSVFHLYQEDGVNIYDREIALQKNIAIGKHIKEETAGETPHLGTSSSPRKWLWGLKEPTGGKRLK